MADRSDTPGHHNDVPVGVALAQLRRRKGLTGLELGRLTGMSQGKVSKIETGAFRPTADDVTRLAKALGADDAQVERLTQQAELDRDHMMDWRFGRKDSATWQREIADLEAGAAHHRSFHPAALSGLLQTSEYARSVLSTMQEAWSDAAGHAFGRVAEAVTARVLRQEILDDPGKQFHFIVPETLLHNLLSRPEDMPGQLERLREVSRQDNVTLKIIPETERLPFPPYHGFSLLDDRHVIIDLFNTVVVTRGQSDLRLYRHVFDELDAHAVSDIGPILDKHRQQYLRRAAGQ